MYKQSFLNLLRQNGRRVTKVYYSKDAYLEDICNAPCMVCSILGDPGAVSRAGRKDATKVFKHRRKRSVAKCRGSWVEGRG